MADVVGFAVQLEPQADITDLYAWMSPDAESLNLVMTVNPYARRNLNDFSPDILYVFHTDSDTRYDINVLPRVDIICEFPQPDLVRCWVGDAAFVSGSTETTLETPDGRLRVFAGLRDDPAFFNLLGVRSLNELHAYGANELVVDPARRWSLLDHIEADEDLSGVLGRPAISVATEALQADRFEGNAILMCAVPVYDR